MSGPVRLGLPEIVETVTAGNAEALEGRGVNASYRVTDGDRVLSVKIHCADRSSGLEFRRILRVDTALRGTAWYPPVIGMGFHPAERPRLVVVRPFAPGAPSDNARQHIVRIGGVLGDLAARAVGVEVTDDLIGDYASPWLSSGERERALADRILTGAWEDLARAMDDHVEDLGNSAARLTRADGTPVIHHGDLHGRNLILDRSRALTVIDWDEAGFSRRPADAAKALWLSCRRARGDFVLDPGAVARFLELVHARLRVPYADAGDLARLGAIWFLPRYGHVALLGQRDASLVPWYLGWVSRFWSRFRRNLDLLTRTAAALERNAGSGGYR
ncbi:phosphotransferase [Streptomyces sp. NPDC053048]|uniref:phosphotransferase n=1 Tax=Streptomyces sp. NPDC053048 TaxID=3365694 RepID=UPI0037CE9B64